MTAFGEGSIQEPAQPWIFSSKRFDPESGFYYFGRRYYSPCLGRFITPDPVGFEDGLNLYVYVHNNPLIHVDPDGQFVFLIPFVVQIGVCYAMEMALPYAVTALEAYGATTSASFLSGAVHGFTGEFEWSALGTGSKLGAAEKAGLAIGEIRSHTSITKLGGMISNVATGAVTGAATRQVTSWFAKGTARAVAQETTAKTVQKTTKVALQNGVANQAVSKTATKGIAKEVADDHIWTRASPFKNKSAKELDAMFRKKGFDPEGPDALNGLGNYINRKNGRQYHIDPKHVGRYAEPNHVDVGRAKGYSGNLGALLRKYSCRTCEGSLGM